MSANADRPAPDATAVLAAFGLDGEAVALDRVPGGWSNDLHRLRTTRGDFALKVIRNRWAVPGWRAWLADGWRVEQAALTAGIAAPQPVEPPGGGCVADVRDARGTVWHVRLHRWVDGASLASGTTTDDVARWVGDSLARLHAVRLTPLDPRLYPAPDGQVAETWDRLAARATGTGADWAEPAVRALPWVRAAVLLLPETTEPRLLGHGDLDPRNVLVTADGPVLCDWDVALPATPGQAVARAALAFARWRDPAVARAVAAGYREAGTELRGPRPDDLGEYLVGWLGWVAFRAEQALGLRPTDDEAAAADDVRRSLEELPQRIAVARDVASWLS